MRRPHVLVAPDSFKGSLTATEVAALLVRGLRGASAPLVTATALPLADGGEGSVAAALAAGFDGVELSVPGATGTFATTALAFDGTTAVVEVASTSGLATLPPGARAPLTASTEGLGLAIRHAVERLGARRLVIALGGSASTDGGAGMLSALGARFLDAAGRPIRPAGGSLLRLRSVDLSELIPLDGIEIIAASDVRSPLLGRGGAARVFGPQKGATPTEVDILEAGLAHLVTLVDPSGRRFHDVPGAGSAGGAGYACLLLGARMVSGADFFLDLLGFDAHLAAADVVLTGEGSMDEQTSRGKLVSAVARRAGGRPVIAVVGRSTLDPASLAALGITAVHALADLTEQDSSRDPSLSGRLLERIGAAVAADLPPLLPRPTGPTEHSPVPTGAPS